MQPGTVGGQRGQNGVGFMEQKTETDMQQDRIGQRGQNGVGFMEQEIQKGIQICSQI